MLTHVTRSGPERVGGDQRHQRGVDPAREADHHAAEAVLLDVVARPERERGVDLGLLRIEPLRDVAARGRLARLALQRARVARPRAASGAPPGRSRVSRSRAVSARCTSTVANVSVLRELRRAGDHAALVVDDHGVPVEDQLVLAADEVAERDGAEVVLRALGSIRSRARPLPRW